MTPPVVQHPAARLVLIGDRARSITEARDVLSQAGYNSLSISMAPTPETLVAEVAQADLVILALEQAQSIDLIAQVQAALPTDTYLPILALVTDGSRAIRRRVLEAGVQECLHTPFDQLEFLLRVRTLLQARMQFRRQTERSQTLARYSADLMVILNEDWQVAYASPSSERLLGRRPAALQGLPGTAHVHPEDQPGLQTALAHCRQLPDLCPLPPFRIYHADGSLRVFEGWVINRLSDPAVAGLVVSVVDVTAQHSLVQSLRDQVDLAVVSQTPQPDQVNAALATALRPADGGQAPLALLLIELAGIADAQMQLSLRAADAAMQEALARLEHIRRPIDTLGRIGDRHLALILPGQQRASALWAARKVLLTLAPPTEVDGVTVQVRPVIGIALAPEHGSDPAALVDAALLATRAAHDHPDRYQVLAPEHVQQTALQNELWSTMRSSPFEEQLVLHYQPKVDVRGGKARVYGVEALVRWQHPQHGLLTPLQFIPLAESVGMINRITRWTFTEAVRQQQRWQDLGLDLSVAVNLSVRSLLDPGLPEFVAALLKQFRVAPDALVAEITETAMMDEQASSRGALGRLATYGVQLALDDFGTGYSSLAHLRGLALSELKIDRSFVRAMVTSPHDKAIVASVIDLAHKLGLRTVAEGVEDHRTLRLAQSLGCDSIQGHCYSPALPPAEFKQWLDHSPLGITKIYA